MTGKRAEKSYLQRGGMGGAKPYPYVFLSQKQVYSVAKRQTKKEVTQHRKLEGNKIPAKHFWI
jgi:hypothetical protein